MGTPAILVESWLAIVLIHIARALREGRGRQFLRRLTDSEVRLTGDLLTGWIGTKLPFRCVQLVVLGWLKLGTTSETQWLGNS